MAYGHGGSRKGAGRKPDPNSKRSQAKKNGQAKRDVAIQRAIDVGVTVPPPPTKTSTTQEFKTVIPVPDEYDMLEFLKAVALGRVEATAAQIKAATAAVQYTHRKLGEGGKKDEKDKNAKEAAAGKFGTAPPPSLKVVA